MVKIKNYRAFTCVYNLGNSISIVQVQGQRDS